MKKAIIIIVAVIILGGGAWWYFNNSAGSAAPVATAPAPLVPTQKATEPAAPAPAGTPNTVTIPASGSTDADLSQEAAAVDMQMSGLNSDNTSADNGLNSQ